MQKIQRILSAPDDQSFFLFGPRGVGKTTWIKNFISKNDIYIDLLKSSNYRELLAKPEIIEDNIPKNFSGWIVIDEIQRIPELLNEVHRLIENNGYKFILTGSSARKLRKQGVNLLAGRALTRYMYPITICELSKNHDFDLNKLLQYGTLPMSIYSKNPKEYLDSYINTYLEEEIKQEGFARNLSAFTRFLHIATFSQGSTINMSEIARECAIKRTTVLNYFSILEDLMIAQKLPVFTKRAKRRMTQHNKFYFFDVGVFKALKPKDLNNNNEQISGICLETLVFQELKAINDYFKLDYEIYYWRTSNGLEVDFILVKENSIIAIEVKYSKTISNKSLNGLKSFLSDYPEAKTFLVYMGDQEKYLGPDKKIHAIPFANFFEKLLKI